MKTKKECMLNYKTEFYGEPVTFLKKCDYDELISELGHYKQRVKELKEKIKQLESER